MDEKMVLEGISANSTGKLIDSTQKADKLDDGFYG